MKRGELATYHMIPPNAIPAIAHVGPPCPSLGPGVGPMTTYMPPVGPPPPPFNNFSGYNGYRPPYNQVCFHLRHLKLSSTHQHLLILNCRKGFACSAVDFYFQIRAQHPGGEMAAWGPPRPPINMYSRPHLNKYEQQVEFIFFMIIVNIILQTLLLFVSTH